MRIQLYLKRLLPTLLLAISWTADAATEHNYGCRGDISISVGEELTLNHPFPTGVYVNADAGGWFLRAISESGWYSDGQEKCGAKIVSKDYSSCTIKGLWDNTDGIQRLELHCKGTKQSYNEDYICYWNITVKSAKPQYGDTFTAKTPEGIDVIFKIINVDEKFCEVGTGESNTPAISNETEGSLTIPQVVSGTTSEGASVNNYTVTGVNKYAFYNCRLLSNVNLPNTIKQIRDYSFKDCRGMKSVVLSSSLLTIGEDAFYSTAIEQIDIPNSVTTIGKNAFCFCTHVKTISVGKSVNSIGELAFYECSRHATSITVANGNSKFDSRGNCNALIETSTNTLLLGCQNTIIPNSVKTIGKLAFESAYGLRKIIIPSSVTTIGESAFRGCIDLVEIDIPNSVTTIENSAFSSCSSVNTITLPNSLTSIGKYAFAFNRWLETVKSSIINPFLISDETFKESRWSNTTLYVPTGTLSKYESTNGWKLFSSIKEGTPEKLTISCNIKGGDVAKGTAIELSSNNPNAEIYYTTDGVNSPGYSGVNGYTSQRIKYNSSIIIEDNCTIMAIARLNGYEASELLVESYNSIPVDVKPDKIELPAEATVVVGQTITLTPTVAPANAEYTQLWSSDDETVAIVSQDGVVTGVKKGQTFINVETDNGKTAYCKLTVTKNVTEKCATPTISYANGQLSFSCDTEDVEYVTEVTVADAKKYYTPQIQLSTVYTVSVYATKDGYENSDVATMEIKLANEMNGDLNGDGEVNITDVTLVLDIINSTK